MRGMEEGERADEAEEGGSGVREGKKVVGRVRENGGGRESGEAEEGGNGVREGKRVVGSVRENGEQKRVEVV